MEFNKKKMKLTVEKVPRDGDDKTMEATVNGGVGHADVTLGIGASATKIARSKKLQKLGTTM